MKFGEAIDALRDGKRVARAGWNGKGMHLRLVEPYRDLKVADATLDEAGIDGTLLPWIGMKTATNGFVPWLASQTDILADDWSVVG